MPVVFGEGFALHRVTSEKARESERERERATVGMAERMSRAVSAARATPEGEIARERARGEGGQRE